MSIEARIEDGPDVVVPWAERDRALEAKLRSLYSTHLGAWIALNKGQMFEQKWHVGREILKWFYTEQMLDPYEYEALHVKHSRPSKPGYDIEFYRIVWIYSGRATEEVATISMAPRMGPSKGYHRRKAPGLQGVTEPQQGVQAPGAEPHNAPRTASSPIRASQMPQAPASAAKEVAYGEGGWIYCYGYEQSLIDSNELGRPPLVKIGHTAGHYVSRIADQVRGTAIPDAPVILRAYRVTDSASFERLLHARLRASGAHHHKAGGTEWFKVLPAELDVVVEAIAISLAQPSQVLP